MLLTWYAPILAFPSVFERIPVRCSPRGASFLPEVALAKGPVNEGQTGDGSAFALFGSTWALVWRRGGTLELYQLLSGAWFQRNPLGGLPVLPDSARHVALSFDQSGRPVIAWENAGEVFARQWDGSAFVVRGGFAGCDPLLICDAVLLNAVPGSDVVMFHLSADRLAVVSRIQNQLYVTPSSVAVLESASYLDQVLLKGPQFELVLGTVSGAEFALRSDVYPFAAFNNLSTFTAQPPTSGVYEPVVIVKDFGRDNLTVLTVAAPAAGSYDPIVIIKDLGTDNLTLLTAQQPLTANYEAVVLVRDVGSDNLCTVTASSPTAGSYEALVLVQTSPTDNLTTATVTHPTGGTYGP